MKKILYGILLSLPFALNAQLMGDFSAQTGSNYAAASQYGGGVANIAYRHSNWEASTMTGLIFAKNRSYIFDAIRIQGTRHFMMKDFPGKVDIFYQWSPYSYRLKEHNIAAVFDVILKKWELTAGAQTRFIALGHSYLKTHDAKKTYFWEPFNLYYRVTFKQPIKDLFDFRASLTNYDNLLITQDVNPFVFVGLDYKMNPESTFYLDLGYQQAGFFNIATQYYGYYVKVGYKMNLDLEKKNTQTTNKEL